MRPFSGKEVTRGLVAAGADVVVACRNQATCGAVAQELQREGHPGRCSCSYVDLEDLDSVKQFSSDLKARLASRRRRLHLLINNAGAPTAVSLSYNYRNTAALHVGGCGGGSRYGGTPRRPS